MASSTSGRAERLSTLIDVGRSVVADLDLETVLGRVVDAAAELTGAHYAALAVLDERREHVAQFITRGIDDQTRRALGAPPSGKGVLGVLISDPRPLRLRDSADHPRSFAFPPAPPPMRTFLGVPIAIRGEPYGNLYLT